MRDEDMNITPPVNVKEKTKKTKAGKVDGMNAALAFSPIVMDGYADDKSHQLEGKQTFTQ